MSKKSGSKSLSFIIPAFNEADNLPALTKEIMGEMKKLPNNWEIIIVNDGSIDNTQKVIEGLHRKTKKIKGIELLTQSGKAAALHAGFQEAMGDIIFTMDADLQDDPKEIPRFINKIEEGYDMVSGWKQNRRDSFIKNKTSKVFNFFTNLISKVKLHDFNCGYKAYKSNVVKDLNLYGELHRYIPVLVAAKGYKVAELPVHHRKRLHGKSKYGFIRFVHGALDLFTVLFITRFSKRPLHLFGYIGLFFLLIGFTTGLYLVGIKLFDQQMIGDRPLLLFAFLMIILGVQIGITGLVSEQLTTMQRRDMGYIIKNVIK